MSSSSIHHKHMQRRVVRIMLAITAIILVIGIPLVVFDDLRLDLAHQLNLAPGSSAEQVAEGDDGAVLVVVPLGEYEGIGRELYAYQAAYIARPSDDGMTLRDIETDESVTVPLESLVFIAADGEGANILFRGPDAEDAGETAVVLETATNTVTVLPEGQETPDLPGDWATPTWAKVVGFCDRFSPEMKYIACFNRPDAASYLAGDWQVDVQLYGDFEVTEPVYRGRGFLPTLGFAHDDNWLYFQNEVGIHRIEVPASLQAHYPDAMETGSEPTS